MSNTIPTPTATTDVATFETEDTVTAAVSALNSGQALAYNSIRGDDFDTKLTILQAITSSEPLSENLGKTINVQNIVIQVIDLADPGTGEMTRVPRILLIADEGTAYHTTSQGILRSLNNLVGVLGHPWEWPSPVPVTVKSVRGKVGSYYTAEFGSAKKK